MLCAEVNQHNKKWEPSDRALDSTVPLCWLLMDGGRLVPDLSRKHPPTAQHARDYCRVLPSLSKLLRGTTIEVAPEVNSLKNTRSSKTVISAGEVQSYYAIPSICTTRDERSSGNVTAEALAQRHTRERET